MRITRLDCGQMHPPMVGSLPAIVLLVELPDRLVAVDSGFGTADRLDPGTRLGTARHVLRGERSLQGSLLHQVRALGHDPVDVRDIVLTHLDLDHAGGISDFPSATIHVSATEHAAAQAPATRERLRYRQVQWAHSPIWSALSGQEDWFGFGGSVEVPGLGGQVVLVPLQGHTRGHAAVAVRDSVQGSWLLHAGDAFFQRGTLTGESTGLVLRTFEQTMAVQRSALAANHARLKSLHEGGEATVICAHDSTYLR